MQGARAVAYRFPSGPATARRAARLHEAEQLANGTQVALTSRDVNGVLREALGETQAQRFAVRNVRSRGNARYRLPPDLQIDLIDQD